MLQELQLDQASSVSSAERRRAQRVILSVPVLLSGHIGDEELKLEARTISLNAYGSLLACGRALPEGAELTLENQLTHVSQICAVTRPTVERDGVFEVPVEFSVPAQDFWQIAFPPLGWKVLQD